MPPASEVAAATVFMVGLSSAIASNPSGVLIQLKATMGPPDHFGHQLHRPQDDDLTSVIAAAVLILYLASALVSHLAFGGFCGVHNLCRFVLLCVSCAFNPAAPHMYSDQQLLIASAVALMAVGAWDTVVLLDAITGVQSLSQIAGTQTCPFCGCTEVPEDKARELMVACADDAIARNRKRTAPWLGDTVDEDHRSFLSTYTFSWISDVMHFASSAPGYLADRKHTAAVPKLPVASRTASMHHIWADFVAWRVARNSAKGVLATPNAANGAAVDLAKFFFLRTPQGRRFLWIVPLKIVQDVTATLVGPIAVAHIIHYIREPATEEGGFKSGVTLLAAVFVALSFQALLFQAYLHHLYRVALDASTAVRVCVHEAVTTSPGYARSGYGHGDVINMATVDASRVSDAIVFLHNLWGHPLMVLVCLGALYHYVGLAPALSAFLSLALLAWVNRGAVEYASTQQKAAAAATSARTADTTDAFQCIRAIKFIGFERPIVSRLFRARDAEVAAETRSITSRALTTLSAELGTALAYAACFVAFYLVDDDFDAARLIPAVSVLNAMRFPIWAFPANVTSIVRGAASGARVAEFLGDVADSRQDHLVVTSPIVSGGGSAAVITRPHKIAALSSAPATVSPGLSPAADPADDGAAAVPVGGVAVKPPFGTSSPVRQGRRAIPASVQYVPSGAIVRCSDDAQAAPHPGSSFNLPLAVEGRGLVVDSGDLLLVSGGTGSGKSTFLRALAREASVSAGDVTIAEANKVAYLPQTPWIFNGTVKDNILCGLPMDRAKYQKVLHCTALLDDVERWEQEDHHDVGNAGAALSGGQKARLGLARACYASAELYLFDDVLCALDESVQRHIVRYCILGYLRNATRIFATTTDLTCPTPALAELSRAAFLCLCIRDGGFAVVERRSATVRCASPFVGESRSTTPHSQRSSTPSLGSRPKPAPPGLSNPASVNAATESARRFGSGWLLLVIGIAAGAQTCLTALDASVGAWSTGRSTSAQRLLGALAFFGLVGSVLSAVRSYVFYRRSLVASTGLHKSVVQRLIHASLSWVEAPTRIGGITAVLTKDQDVTDHAIPESIEALVASVLKLVAVCLFNAMVQPVLLLLMPPIVASFASVTRRYLDGARDMRRLEAVVKNDVVGCLHNGLRGGAVARGIGATPMMQKDHAEALDAVNAATNAGNLLARWVGLRLEAVAMLLAFAVACLAVASRGTVNAAFAGVAVSNCLSVTRTMLMLCRRVGMFQAQVSSVEQLVALHGAVPPAIDPNAVVVSSTTAAAAAGGAVLKSAPLGSPGSAPYDLRRMATSALAAIAFYRVAVRYAGQNYDTVSDVSFHVSVAEHVTLVGRTGAGKSTLVSALLGHATVTQGAVTVLGISVADANTLRPSGGGLPSKIRNQVGVVPQEPMLLPRLSWRQHLINTEDPDSSVPDEWIRAALATVGLDRLCTTSMSLDAPVEAGGNPLSPSQAQLLSFARVLCMPAVRLVILDEVAASVDVATEKMMLAALKSLPTRPAILSIAHGGQSLCECDRIIDLTAPASFDDTPMGSFEPGPLLDTSGHI